MAEGVLNVRAWHSQHIGRRREQQDVIETVEDIDGVFLAVLADGMGGMLMGRECAEKAVSTFVESFAAREKSDIALSLRLSAERANELVFRMAAENGAAEMAGCTLLAAAISDGRMYWVSVGDSHLYILHGGCLRQLNTDHNLRTRLMRAKGNEAGAWEDKDINLSALTSYVGAARLEEIDISAEPLTLTGPDVVLLCSDGLYNALTEGEIEEILSSAAADKAAALLDEALSKGITNQDNISAITVLREIDNHITDILPVDEKTIIIKGRKDNRLRIFSSLLRLLHLSKQDGGDCNGF